MEKPSPEAKALSLFLMAHKAIKPIYKEEAKRINKLWTMVKDGELNSIKADRQPIGEFADRKPFTVHQLQLSKIESIYLTTDGYVDQFGGPKNKKFKIEFPSVLTPHMFFSLNHKQSMYAPSTIYNRP